MSIVSVIKEEDLDDAYVYAKNSSPGELYQFETNFSMIISINNNNILFFEFDTRMNTIKYWTRPRLAFLGKKINI